MSACPGPDSGPRAAARTAHPVPSREARGADDRPRDLPETTTTSASAERKSRVPRQRYWRAGRGLGECFRGPARRGESAQSAPGRPGALPLPAGAGAGPEASVRNGVAAAWGWGSERSRQTARPRPLPLPLPLPGGRGQARLLPAARVPAARRAGAAWRAGDPFAPWVPAPIAPRRLGRAQCERAALGTSSALGAVCRGGRRRPGPAKVDDPGRQCREPGPSEGPSGGRRSWCRGLWGRH